MITKEKLAGMVDHTSLNMDATKENIEKLCREANECGFGAVCVRQNMMDVAFNYITKHQSDFTIALVVGFPTKKCLTQQEMIDELAKYTLKMKVEETKKAINNGIDEIDMVINLGAMKKGEYNQVEDEIESIKEIVEDFNILKVIIETCYLTNMEKILACKIAETVEADFIKTSTGFGVSGATLEDIELLGKYANTKTGIKASGGISTIEQAIQLYEASQKFRKHEFRVGSSKLAEEYRKTAKTD